MSVKSAALDATYAYFQRVDRTPPGHWRASAVLGTPAGDARRANISRRLAEMQLPVDPLGSTGDVPLEAAFVVAPKDFDILPISIDGVLTNSGHPITRVVLITTERGMPGAADILSRFTDRVDVEARCEDDVIISTQRVQLKRSFENRYGWILQQLLCVAQVIQSKAPAVLLMDADTVLTRPRALISSDRQILMPSLENHAPYYVFLRSLAPEFADMHHTFVSHHMVQQPHVMRSILDSTVGGFDGLVSRVLASADNSKESAICVDFELYAQALLAVEPMKVTLAKWSNAAAVRPRNLDDIVLADISCKFSKYCSVSFHSYVN